MKNIAKKMGAASAYPKDVNLEPGNLNGPQVGPEVNNKDHQSSRQDGPTSPAPISTPPYAGRPSDVNRYRRNIPDALECSSRGS